MSEKLDLFELSVKRGLENYEVHMESGAWENFHAHMTGGAGAGAGTGSSAAGGSSFLGRFGVAASALIALGLFVNHYSEQEAPDTHSPEMVQNLETEQGDANAADNYHFTTTEDATSAEDQLRNEFAQLDSPEANTETSLTSGSSDLSDGPVKNAIITSGEEERMAHINSSLQAAADRVESDDLEMKTVTHYVGENFDLGAPSEFSPNGDGDKDVFMPGEISPADQFTLTITDSEGATVFTSSQIDRPWDGTDSLGQPSEAGRYRWEVTMSQGKNQDVYKGYVKLKR